MKKIFTLCILTLLPFCSVFSQTYKLYGDKTFGTAFNEFNVTTIAVGDHNLIVTGSTQANINGDKTDPKCDSTNIYGIDAWILKIDTDFTIIWNKSIGGSKDEFSSNLLVDNKTSQILLSSGSNSDSSCEKSSMNRSFPQHFNDYWISTLDSNGIQVKDKTWGGNYGDEYPQMIQLKSGNFIICGSSGSLISGDKTVAPYNSSFDYWIVKTDSSGNKIWDNVYGGDSTEYGYGTTYMKGVYITAANNDNFVLAGTTSSPISGSISDSSKGGRDIWVIKIDSIGNKIWDKRYGGIGNEFCDHITHSADNGFVICGSTASPQGGDLTDPPKGIGENIWVIKLDSMGNKQWDHRYGGSTGSTFPSGIEEAPGGGYWVSGYTNSDSSFDVSEHPYGLNKAYDYWVLKIDSVGNKIWDKRFGGPGLNYSSGLVIMPDSSIFLYGTAEAGVSPIKTDSGKGGTDYWLVHFKYTDPVFPVGINEIVNFNNSISLFPNPTKDLITINSSTEKIKQIELFNILGESIYTQKINNVNSTQINLQSYAPGFYLVKITGEKYSVTKKVLKE